MKKNNAMKYIQWFINIKLNKKKKLIFTLLKLLPVNLVKC